MMVLHPSFFILSFAPHTAMTPSQVEERRKEKAEGRREKGVHVEETDSNMKLPTQVSVWI